MIQIPNSFQYLPMLYGEFKFWSGLCGGFWIIFKGFNWVKEIRTTDLKHIQTGVDSLKVELKDQTSSIVSAMSSNTDQLKELRQDMKTFTTAFIVPPVRARAAKAARRKK